MHENVSRLNSELSDVLLIEEAGQHEAGIIEDELHIHILRRFGDLIKVARSAEVDTNLDELARLELLLQFCEGFIQKIFLECN